ncbi:MAG: 50S ribosomal protein L6 [Chloroflexi bacterium]|nr:50S ribosomal protein L6 [Chloroflexota bacterium]
MSRVGSRPVSIPPGVEVIIRENHVSVNGPKGSLMQIFHPSITVSKEDEVLKVSRPSNEREHRSLHGLTRALLANMVTGVAQGFQKSLDLVGVGYRVQQMGDNLQLQVGFSHTVEIVPLPGIKFSVEGNNRINIQGVDKQLVGETAARIRRIRPPNSYTGKGIKYSYEQPKLKAGKSAKRT